MSRYEHGRVLAVNETTLGSELVGAHAQGVGSLTVEDPVDFDEDGGWLSINGQVAEYSTYDDDTGEITLVGTLDAAAGEGDRVDLWDELRQVVTIDKIAQVELDGDDDNTDPLEAVIPLHLLDDLAEGIRGVRGESVLLEQDGDEWRIVDVLGLAANGASGTQFWNDPHTVTTTGQQTIALTHEPINNSEHLYWNGLYQPASVWSRNGQTITVPDGAGHLLAGDELTVEYAYRVGMATPRLQIRSTTAAQTSGSSLAVPITGARAGDLLLLAIGRKSDTTAPAGWTLADVVNVGASYLRVYSRTSDGTETAVTVTGTSDVMAGICVVVAGDVADVASATLSPASGASFPTPGVTAGSPVAFVSYDSLSDVADIISGADQPLLENVNVAGGRWSIAAAAASATFTSGGGDPASAAWLGITVGVV